MAAIHRVRADVSSGALGARFEAALALASEAGALAMQMRPGPGAAQASLKDRQDWLTEADGAVEALLSERLLELFPEDGFQGEETGSTRAGALRWVVDPIDGTSNFARGGTRWCVSIGLLAGEAAVLGVLAAPASGELYAGVRGGGATLNGAAIRAAGTVAMERAIVEVGWSPRTPNGAYAGMCAAVLEAGAMLRSGGSGALGLAEVAAGRLDGYVERHINLWDCAAALAILGEAGAVVNDFLPGGMVAGGPVLAAAPGVSKAVAAILDGSLAG